METKQVQHQGAKLHPAEHKMLGCMVTLYDATFTKLLTKPFVHALTENKYIHINPAWSAQRYPPLP